MKALSALHLTADVLPQAWAIMLIFSAIGRPQLCNEAAKSYLSLTCSLAMIETSTRLSTLLLILLTILMVRLRSALSVALSVLYHMPRRIAIALTLISSFPESNDRVWLDSIIELSSLNNGNGGISRYLNDFGFGYKTYLEKVFSALLGANCCFYRNAYAFMSVSASWCEGQLTCPPKQERNRARNTCNA